LLLKPTPFDMRSLLIIAIIIWSFLPYTACDKKPEYQNQPPTARITATPSSGEIPFTVQFDGSASTDPESGPLTYFWEFSDGSSSTASSLSKTFSTAGTKSVTLTVTDDVGLTSSAQKTITANEPPQALFPIAEGAQWVYFVKHTETENGAVSGYDEGYIYLILEERDPEYENIDVLDFRITGKKYYNKTSLIPGDRIHMMHNADDFIQLYHDLGTYSTMLDMNATSWNNYVMLFSQSSSQTATRSSASISIGLGTFFTHKISHHRDNWGVNYVTERYDITETEYLNPEIGMIYRETSRYVNFLDCFTCPVYGGGTEMELVGYSIPQAGGTALESGTGYNPNNPYGGDLGLLTIWAEEDIGYTEVFLDGEYVGTITNYWPGGISCDQDRALNVTFPSGSYYLTAESSKGYYWEGTVTFTTGSCDDIQLLLSNKASGNSQAIPLASLQRIP